MASEQEFFDKMHELANGKSLPMTAKLNRAGQVIAYSFESEWNEGGTEPVIETDAIKFRGKIVQRERVASYNPKYQQNKLTAAEQAAINKYIITLGIPPIDPEIP